MAKKMNSVFFFICFIAALLGEIFCIVRIRDYISVIGIGIVVLILGYLFINTLKYEISEGKSKGDHREINTDQEKLAELCKELLMIQKATYTATKKNGISTLNYAKELQNKMDSLEIKLLQLEQYLMNQNNK